MYVCLSADFAIQTRACFAEEWGQFTAGYSIRQRHTLTVTTGVLHATRIGREQPKTEKTSDKVVPPPPGPLPPPPPPVPPYSDLYTEHWLIDCHTGQTIGNSFRVTLWKDYHKIREKSVACFWTFFFSVKVNVFHSFFVFRPRCMSYAITSRKPEQTGKLFWDSVCCVIAWVSAVWARGKWMKWRVPSCICWL